MSALGAFSFFCVGIFLNLFTFTSLRPPLLYSDFFFPFSSLSLSFLWACLVRTLEPPLPVWIGRCGGSCLAFVRGASEVYINHTLFPYLFFFVWPVCSSVWRPLTTTVLIRREPLGCLSLSFPASPQGCFPSFVSAIPLCCLPWPWFFPFACCTQPNFPSIFFFYFF